MTQPAATSAAENRRGFWSLVATQFQGAFSDLTFRTLISLLILGMGLPQEQRDLLVPAVGALFSLPFILFSMTGGYLADRFSKRRVTIGIKVLEVAIMLAATAALASYHLALLLVALFLMATQSALFGPSKYGLLPELLPEKRLSWGNGILAMTTILAVISGTVAGGLLAETFAGRQQWSGFLLVALAFVGLGTSLGIARVPAADPAKKFRVNILGDLWTQLVWIRADRVLKLAVLGNIYFWFFGALVQYNVLLYGADVLGLGEKQISYLMAAIAVGVAIGCAAAGFLSANKIEYGLIPLGAIGMTVCSAALSQAGLSPQAVGVWLALLGFSSGFFVIPTFALIQHRPDPERKGAILGATNVLTFVGIFVSSGVFWLMKTPLALSPRQIFLASAVMTLAGAVYVVRLLPDSLLRLWLWILVHSLYRIRVEGRDHIPEKGGALFVANHLSFIDGLLLQASTDRPIRFLMFKDIYELPWIRPLARVMRAIPISSYQRPREMIRSLRDATDSIRAGEVVCIFAEGQITRIGHLLPFRRGLERIMKGLDAPIIPVHLGGVWGSIFSFERGRFFWKLPRRVPYPVTVSYGAPLAAETPAFEVRQAVQQLETESFRFVVERLRPLHRMLLRAMRRYPLRMLMADARVAQLSYGAALVKTVFLARRLRRVWQDEEMAGILLPPSVGGALVNFAALLLGKAPVNLNYTLSDDALASCASQCNLKKIVTSQAFIERLKVRVPGETALLEELAAGAGLGEKLLSLLIAWTLPARLLERAAGRERRGSLDDLATVIFSSGTTGEPKGVMLTHSNIAANIEQMDQVFVLQPDDRVLGILPFFHSFGFTATLLLPAAMGIGAVYHPNPLDPRGISELVRRYLVTFLVATPTFLQAYIRRCSPEDFGSLRFVLVGAEKLPERVSVAFEDTFGVRPLEGYGCTECAPAVAVNRADFRAPGFRQVGAKRGKIGHPLPGVTVRIADPDTFATLSVGQPGLLLVRGPNVMKGYLGQPEKTAAAFHDGFYVTGDIAVMDEDGFIEITDRLSRFSKIGGEMVPHIKIEEKLHELAGATEQCFAVTALPDARKGERLVVLHTLPEEKVRDVLERLPAAGLPNLWMPRASLFFRIEALPVTGTGKLDLRGIRDRARQLAPAESA